MITVSCSAQAIRFQLMKSKSKMPAFKLEGALTPQLVDELLKLGVNCKYLGSKSVGKKLTQLQDYIRVWRV